MSAESDVLAAAWEAGFAAASDRTRRAILLAAAVGFKAAIEQIDAEGPTVNPYRVSGGTDA